MESKWNANIVKDLESRAEAALNVIGAHMVGMVEPVHNVTTNLKNSITYATSTQQPAPPNKVETGDALSAPDKTLTLKVGTTVEYAARVEFGFVGKDSLGRTYNQSGKPFLRPLLAHKDEFKNFLIEQLKK